MTEKTFKLYHNEICELNYWISKHNCSFKDQTASDGNISVIFTPTQSGVSVTIKCLCGAEVKLREIE